MTQEQIRAEFEQDYPVLLKLVQWSGEGYISQTTGDTTDLALRANELLEAYSKAHARYAIPECHSVIDGKRTEDMGNKELRYHLQESSKIMQRQADEIAELKARYAGGGDNCEDCPPADYPTDETRCEPCPRRSSAPAVPGEKQRLYGGPYGWNACLEDMLTQSTEEHKK